MKIFKPKAISISATCPVGLIGDDIEAVARKPKKNMELRLSLPDVKGIEESASQQATTLQAMF